MASSPWNALPNVQNWFLLIPLFLIGTVAQINPNLSIPPGVKSAGCQFPDSIQGLYKRQDDTKLPVFDSSGTRMPIQYQEYFIGPTSIPHWGDCYYKENDVYVLGVKKVGGYFCFRCFTILRRTPNVLEVLISREAEDISFEYCPITGRADLSYLTSNGLMQCQHHAPSVLPGETSGGSGSTPLQQLSSSISNCKRGYQLDISFKSCSFTRHKELSFECLGSWTGGGRNERYFAVYNTEVEEYRCGIYRDDAHNTGMAYASMSNDSTCFNMLDSAENGFEMFKFYKKPVPEWPMFPTAGCFFPNWIQGDWEVMTVGKDLLSYFHHQDPSTMTTQYAKCVAISEDKIQLYSRNHCGDDEGYGCLWLSRRSHSVIEFKMANRVLPKFDRYQCDAPNAYDNSSWITIAAREPTEFVPCAHSGTYATAPSHNIHGSFCFNVSVDCDRPHRMITSGFICSSTDVFEKIAYECLASWKEDDIYYSYVQRIEDNVKGCFVSKVVNNQIRMVWSGKQCNRNIDFSEYDEPPSPHDTPDSTAFVLQQLSTCQIPNPDAAHNSKPPISNQNRNNNQQEQHQQPAFNNSHHAPHGPPGNFGTKIYQGTTGGRPPKNYHNELSLPQQPAIHGGQSIRRPATNTVKISPTRRPPIATSSTTRHPRPPTSYYHNKNKNPQTDFHRNNNNINNINGARMMTNTKTASFSVTFISIMVFSLIFP